MNTSTNSLQHPVATLRAHRRPALLTSLALAWLLAAMPLARAQTQYTWKNLAGSPGGPGNADGSGGRFDSPTNVAVDSAGTVYVADFYNDTIRKITPAGVVSTLAGQAGLYGSADGQGSAAQFSGPTGVAVDFAGIVYVADSNNDTIRKITPAGVVSTFAGSPGLSGSADGTGSAARFNRPAGVAVDSAGHVYVTDFNNHTIRKITPAGVVSTLAGSPGLSGSANGKGGRARFNYPDGVALDSAGNLYVTDSNNDTIRKITPARVVTTFAGRAGHNGHADNTGTAARFYHPTGVAVDAAGNVYVTDTYNDTIRMITPAGLVSTLAGKVGIYDYADGKGSAARFYAPSGVAVDSAGRLYVADTDNEAVRMITPAGVVTTLAGSAIESGSDDGKGNAARFDRPQGVAVDSAGNTYVADTYNDTIRKITPAGVVTTFAGTAGSSGTTDGKGSAARFLAPRGVAVDSAGNVYVADSDNHTIRKITPVGVVTTFAGSAGTFGSTDGVGATARFSSPTGVAVDSAGNLYVADTGNGTIRKITPARLVTTFAGTAGQTGSTDGAGSAARFSFPWSVAVDSAGHVYVADTGNDTIRKISPGGAVTTLAGSAGHPGSTDGVGSAARLDGPAGIAVDAAGHVYVSDTQNDTIRMITPAGTVTTIGGRVNQMGSTDGKGGASRFDLPQGLAVDAAGKIYVADTDKNHIETGVTP